MILLEEKEKKEDVAKYSSEVGGRHDQGERSYPHFIFCARDGQEAQYCWTPSEKIIEIKEQKQDKGKAHESTHYIFSQCNIGVNDLFTTSFSS